MNKQHQRHAAVVARLLVASLILGSLVLLVPAGASAQVACNPRPRVSIQTSLDAGRLRVVVLATTTSSTPTNSLRRIQFARMENAQVDAEGRTGVAQPFTVDLPPGTGSYTFYVRRVTSNGGATVHLVVEDACGTWPTFVGGGPNALPPNPVPTPSPPPPPPPPGGQPIVISGQGPQASARFRLEAGLVTMKAQKSGSFYLGVELLAANGDYIDSMFLPRDEDVGVTADEIAATGEYLVNVDASGDWTITIEQPRPTAAPPPQQTYTGTRGESLTPFFQLSEGLTILRGSHSGAGSLSLSLRDARGGLVEWLYLPRDETSGAQLDGLDQAGIHFVEVDAEGDWSLSVEQPRPGSAPPAPQTFGGGKGQSVTGFVQLGSGVHTLRASQSGPGDLWVWLAEADGDYVTSMHLDDGVTSGSKAVTIRSGGIHLFEIDADGPWTVTIE